jgi:hypothetical protein
VIRVPAVSKLLISSTLNIVMLLNLASLQKRIKVY